MYDAVCFIVFLLSRILNKHVVKVKSLLSLDIWESTDEKVSE